jgi:DNA-binding CsgD family transcriptional regulator
MTCGRRRRPRADAHCCCSREPSRSALAAGEALRRLGERRRAAEKLEAAKEIFAALGAPLWLARAEKELRRASPRPRRHYELTSAERRVAALVAAGRTNREVAAQLFTTVGTVEVHLTRIYRRLGLRSRTELARQVAEGRALVAPSRRIRQLNEEGTTLRWADPSRSSTRRRTSASLRPPRSTGSSG